MVTKMVDETAKCTVILALILLCLVVIYQEPMWASIVGFCGY